MARFSVLDLKPTVSVESHDETEVTIANVDDEVELPNDLNDIPVDETVVKMQRATDGIRDVLAPVDNAAKDIVAAENYYQVLVKYKQTNVVVSNEVFDVISLSLGLERSTLNRAVSTAETLINYIRKLVEKLWELINKGYNKLVVFIKAYGSQLNKLEKRFDKVSKNLTKEILARPNKKITVREDLQSSFISSLTKGFYDKSKSDSVTGLILNILKVDDSYSSGIRSDKFILPGGVILNYSEDFNEVAGSKILTKENFTFDDSNKALNDETFEINSKDILSKFREAEHFIKNHSGELKNTLLHFSRKKDYFEKKKALLEKGLDNLDENQIPDVQGLTELVRIRDRIKVIPKLLEVYYNVMIEDLNLTLLAIKETTE